MINTIFYFPESLTFEDYVSKLASGDIASRTIVFADAQKAIYNRGKKYGGVSSSEFHDMVDSLYDDSWIKDEIDGIKRDILLASGRIDSLNTLIGSINTRLEGKIESLDQDIQDKIEALFDDAQWLRQNFDQGVVSWKQEWNDQIAAYLRTVGYWDTDEFGNEIYKWSKIQQSVNSISSTVNDLVTNGNISQALTSSIEQLVQGKIAQLNLGTTYATINDVNGVKDVIEWLYSGLKTQSDPTSTFAEISSAGKNAISSAISSIRTYVEKLQNGDYVTDLELTSKVRNTIVTLIAQASDDNALAALSAKANANSADIAAILLAMTGSSSTADIQTRVSSALSGFLSTADLNTAKSEIYSAISAKDGNDNFISLAALKTAVDANTASISAISTNGTDTSGFVSRAGLGEAVSELFASSGNGQSEDAKASVVALVRDNKSSLNLSASDVNIDGYLNAGNATFKGNVQANQFITGGDSDSGISVMSGQFDSTRANTNKAYFAYDSAQGAVTMWFYQNGTWKCIDLGSSTYTPVQEGFITHTLYTNLDETSIQLPSNPTSVNVYESRVTGKYYVSPDSTSNYASGTYYNISRYRTSVDAYYKSRKRNSNQFTNLCIVPLINNETVDFGSESSIPENGRIATETLIAADVTKVIINSSGELQQSNYGTAHAYYMIKNINTEPTGPLNTDDQTLPDDAYKLISAPIFVREANLNRIVNCYLLNGAVYYAIGRTDTENTVSAFAPCTLGQSLTYVSPYPATGGSFGLRYSDDLGITVKYYN